MLEKPKYIKTKRLLLRPIEIEDTQIVQKYSLDKEWHRFLEIHTKEILTIKSKLNEILAKHSGQKVDKVAKDSDRDNFMSPDEAVKYGLIDNVVDSRLKE